MNTDKDRASLAAKFEHHADEEGVILDAYRTLADKLGDGTAGNLISHILTEEELHHLLLRTLAKWLREGRSERDDAIPASANRADLLRLTERLQQHEQETLEACRRLQSQLSGEAEVLTALLEAVMLDTQKHQRLLRVTERLLKA